MKKNKTTTGVLALLTLCFLSSLANASQILNCDIGNQQGTAKIEVLSVVGHPLLKVFKIEMTTKLGPFAPNGTAQLGGLLTAQLDSQGNVFASGLVENSNPSGSAVINPENITLQGEAQPNGELLLRLYDSDRVLQAGFGVSFECR